MTRLERETLARIRERQYEWIKLCMILGKR